MAGPWFSLFTPFSSTIKKFIMPNNCNLQYIFTYILQWNKFDNWDSIDYSGACIGQQIRKVCRCQKGYRKSYIEEVQAMQWPSEKGQNDKQWSTKNYTENWRLSSTNPTLNPTELCRWQLESSVLHCMAVPGFVRWSTSLIFECYQNLSKIIKNSKKQRIFFI